MLEVKELNKIYKTGEVETVALQGVSFEIESGEFLSIMGPSGSGKSTLMHIMGFLDRPTSGVCLFEGKSINQLDDEQLARIRNKRMGFVFQTFNLLPRLTVFENVRLPLVYASLSDQEEKEMVQKAVKAVDLLDRIDYYPNQLSGGEQQRVAIARALANEPSVIFADEPTGNLDSKTGNEIMKVLQDLNKAGNTIVLVTHEKYTSEHAERMLHLKDGRLVGDGSVSQRKWAQNNSELTK